MLQQNRQPNPDYFFIANKNLAIHETYRFSIKNMLIIESLFSNQ